VRASRLLFGVEADVSFPDFFRDGVVASRTTAQGSNVAEKIDLVSALRGRLGYATDRWLLYGSGGFALSEQRFFESSAAGSDSDKILRFRTGWAVGAGAELAIAPNWTAKLEYVYDQFGSAGGVFSSGTAFESRSDIHSLRLGLSRQLGGGGADARASRPRNRTATENDRWNIHGQDTFIEQGYFKFRSPYEGTLSLSGASQVKNTESATAFLGVRW
jgi:high affinity Mn2+ porin